MQNALQSVGHEVVLADSGLSGIEKAQGDADINLIIADINMSGMNGIEMCERIRQIPHHKDTVIIMCTTESSVKLKERAKSIGVKAWIVKPIDDVRLQKVVQMIFEKKPSP